MALRKRNSGAESGRELFKGLKDLASLIVSNKKKFLAGGCTFFVSDIIGGRLKANLAHCTWPWAQTVRW